jgi:hypothetical protein
MVRAFSASLLIGLSVAAGAANESKAQQVIDSIGATVNGVDISLSTSKRQRLPYARDISLRVYTRTKAQGAAVAYSLKGSKGARAGLARAEPLGADGKVWVAAMVPLHVNETGEFRADVFSAPTYRVAPVAGRPAHLLLARAYIQELAALPSVIPAGEFITIINTAAGKAIATTYADAPAVLVVREPDNTHAPLSGVLVRQVAQDLALTNALNELKDDAEIVSDRLTALLALNPLADHRLASCAMTSVGAVRERAAALQTATSNDVLDQILIERIPWPQCVVDLLESAPVTDVQRPILTRALAGARRIVDSPALAELAGIARRVASLTQSTVLVETLNVPIGGEELERYTQTDVAMVYMPHKRYGLQQPFATVTWYAAANELGDNPEFAASISPSTFRERFALQFGYPVGSPSREGVTPFEPAYLAGALVRLNSLFSLSAGAIFGKAATEQRREFYVSTNFDLSNLGPFQKLFARPDPP